jgi:hypothetical protein
MNTTNRTRPTAARAYYRGRSATWWQAALRRRGHDHSPITPPVANDAGASS